MFRAMICRQASLRLIAIIAPLIPGDAAGDPMGGFGPSRPECTAQRPSALRHYRVRPVWRVAGVDYCVGPANDIAQKSPETVSIAGVRVNTGSRSITITGNNVTLDGYDFSG